MPLAEIQRALARTFTNDHVCDMLREDPVRFARTFDLSPVELEWIASIGEGRVRGYTDSLDRKRASECARLLPASARYLGPRFRRECLHFARRVALGEGPERYREDAVAFARRLLRLRGEDALDGQVRALLAYESSPRTHIGFYAYRVPELTRRWTLVLRFGGRELHI
jgi:hypothetical protein